MVWIWPFLNRYDIVCLHTLFCQEVLIAIHTLKFTSTESKSNYSSEICFIALLQNRGLIEPIIEEHVFSKSFLPCCSEMGGSCFNQWFEDFSEVQNVTLSFFYSISAELNVVFQSHWFFIQHFSCQSFTYSWLCFEWQKKYQQTFILPRVWCKFIVTPINSTYLSSIFSSVASKQQLPLTWPKRSVKDVYRDPSHDTGITYKKQWTRRVQHHAVICNKV